MDNLLPIILIVAAIGILILGILSWLGILKTLRRSAFVVIFTRLLDSSKTPQPDDKPFEPEQSFGEILTERAEEVDFDEAVERHRTAEMQAVHVEDPLQENLVKAQTAPRSRAYIGYQAAMAKVRRAFRFLRITPPPLEHIDDDETAQN
ncbi:MAG: hypothetical protein D6712_16760 [Chloroflexi bacterium]|nr:MAG: hypothetical protein D6712_16760 [Chloroflexota bacterium]